VIYQKPTTTGGEKASEHWMMMMMITTTIIIIIMNDGDNGTHNKHGEHDVRIMCSEHKINKKYTICKFSHVPCCSLDMSYL
jgi:hypothetical protein